MEFLKAPRFWAMITGAASVVLIDPNTMIQPWFVSLGKFLAIVSVGFVSVRSLDRTVDKLSEK